VADTFVSPLTTRVHEPRPVQAPSHPVHWLPESAGAVHVIVLPAAALVRHVVPQSMVPALLATLPFPRPPRPTPTLGWLPEAVVAQNCPAPPPTVTVAQVCVPPDDEDVRRKLTVPPLETV